MDHSLMHINSKYCYFCYNLYHKYNNTYGKPPLNKSCIKDNLSLHFPIKMSDPVLSLIHEL